MKGPSHCKHGELRRQSPNGILEFCDRGMWSVICGDFWTDRIASVVCQQMSYASEGTNSFRYIIILFIVLLLCYRG